MPAASIKKYTKSDNDRPIKRSLPADCAHNSVPPCALNSPFGRPIDVLEQSPLVRGIHLTLNYAADHGEIGLTKSQAMHRKFVHWSADAFRWPDYTADDLFAINKVLNEQTCRPWWRCTI